MVDGGFSAPSTINSEVVVPHRAFLLGRSGPEVDYD
jgi:hypothetical protein